MVHFETSCVSSPALVVVEGVGRGRPGNEVLHVPPSQVGATTMELA